MTEPTPPPVKNAPVRRRLRAWARRHVLATFVCALVALALLLRLGWGWYSARRLAAALDDVRRRGEPMAVSDFAESALPPSDNAWTHYAEAARVVSASGVRSPRESTIEYPPYPPRGPQWESLAAASERGNAAAFQLARKARPLHRLQFPQTKPPGNAFRREWNDARTLANTLGDGAEYAHLRGDDAEAVERLLDGLHLGRSVRQDPSILSQLVGLGISALALDAAQQIVPTLNLGAPARGTAASPAQARLLLAALLDEDPPRQWFVRTLYRERIAMLAALDQLAAETWAIHPAADATAVRWLREFDLLIKTAGQQNGRQARKTLRLLRGAAEPDYSSPFGLPGRQQPVPRYSRWFDGFGVSGPEGLARSLEMFHRESAERRMTAVMLAARLYRKDHGRWPDDAAALVPAYLDAIPADPLRDNGGPLGYVVLRGALPDGADWPMVFSDASEAGGAAEEAIDTEPMYGWQARPRRDVRQYRDVSLWEPTKRRFEEAQEDARKLEDEMTRPLNLPAEAVDHDPDKPDAPGKDAKDHGAAGRPAKE